MEDEKTKFLNKEGLIFLLNLINKKYYTKEEVIEIIEGVLPHVWKGSLEEFNDITEKDDDCIYFIKSDINVEE